MVVFVFMYTLWLFNIAMENDPFVDDFPIKTSISSGFSMAMLNNQMVGDCPTQSSIQRGDFPAIFDETRGKITL